MNAARVTLIVAICVLIAGVAGAQTEWVEHPDNPVIGFDEVGEWAPGGPSAKAVVFDGATFHMWFIGWNEAVNGVTGIGHATSTDGLDWTMDPANPVLTEGADGEWDEYHVVCGEVIHVGGQFHMWYTGRSDSDAREPIGYATSPDGSVWTKYAGNPVMEPGPPGSWDDWGIVASAVIYDGGVFKMWYDGGHDDHILSIGYAESTDGIEWTKRPEPVLEPANDPEAWDASVWNPAVVYDGTTYHMWYGAHTLNWNVLSIGYATSADGIEWAEYPDNPLSVVEAEGENILQARVLRDGDVWKMWFTLALEIPGVEVSYATSDCCVARNFQRFIPAAAVASGAQGSFYQTDVDLNNAGEQAADYEFVWLPRGQVNTDPMTSETFNLDAGMSVRYGNVLSEVFGLEPNSLGAILVRSSSPDLLAMSRTYNNPEGEDAGTFGQAIPAVPPSDFIGPNEKRRILFASENEDLRFNVGCQSGNAVRPTVINIELFDDEGTSLERTMMILPAFSNDQLNRVFEDYMPVNGYVDVWTTTEDRSFYCYGSVLDNVTSDPTTVLPQ